MSGRTESTFSFEVVSCLVAALNESGTTLSMKHYKLMAQVDKARSAGGYDHLFRAVKTRAREIRGLLASGELDAAAPTPKKAGNTKKGATPAAGRKRGRKATAEEAAAAEEDDEETETASKKAKMKAEESEDDDERL